MTWFWCSCMISHLDWDCILHGERIYPYSVLMLIQLVAFMCFNKYGWPPLWKHVCLISIHKKAEPARTRFQNCYTKSNSRNINFNVDCFSVAGKHVDPPRMNRFHKWGVWNGDLNLNLYEGISVTLSRRICVWWRRYFGGGTFIWRKMINYLAREFNE